MNKISIAVSVAALFIYGCSDKPKEQDESAKTQKVQESDTNVEKKSIYGTSTTQPASEDVVLNTPHIGVVLESVNSGGYTYARVDDGGNIYWIAGPMSTITKGTAVSFIEQMVMVDFTSKSLDKKFESLMFVSAMVPVDKAGKAIATQGHDHSHEAHDSITKTDASTPIKIAKNTKGYSIEEIFAKKDSLKDKKVKIDAQVVKVSKGIMGKDWIHLQDGSGAEGTNDIIATAVMGSTVQVGDKVTTDGVVKTDVDLGYGYKFSIIIDEAKFTYLK
ncbi:MAG: hypothetical protein L3J44_06215 [Campylobacteraceae bacterium]|nr:hypothetical protein [Campylobacteraceae bacterium]